VTPRPNIVVVTAVPPDPRLPHGFAGRATSFIDALREMSEVTIARADGSDFAAQEVQLPADVASVDVAPTTPLRTNDQRTSTWGLPRLSRPLDLVTLGAMVERLAPVGVVLLLPGVAHAAFSIPERIPVVAALDEGLERQVWEWMLPLSPLRRWAVEIVERMRFVALYRRLVRRGVTVVAISDEEKDRFARRMPASSIHVVPHGIDTSYFAPGPGGHEIYDVGMIGDHRAARNRDPAHELIEAARRDASAGALKWVIGGMIEDAQRLEATEVSYSGFLPDLRPLYDTTRIVAVPSHSGTGAKTAVLQAWAMQKPVVATPFAVRGLPARDGENVLLGAGPGALLAQARSLLADPDLRTRVAANGRATVSDERDSRVVAERFGDVCRAAFGLPSESS